MQVFYGQTCPCYDWVRADGERCGRCKMCERRYSDSVECLYSAIPTSEPKFSVGQTVYYAIGIGSDIVYHSTIRKVEWNRRYQWEYTFKRERTPHGEDTLFATHQEAALSIIQKSGRVLLEMMKRYSEKYKIPIENIQKLLEQGG